MRIAHMNNSTIDSLLNCIIITKLSRLSHKILCMINVCSHVFVSGRTFINLRYIRTSKMVEISIAGFKLYTEVPILLFFYSLMVSESVHTNFIIYRTCYVSLGYNESDCAALGSGKTNNASKHLEEIVQPYANVILMTSSLTSQILPSFLCLFVGPWSDKNGRKPVMIFAMIGFTINGVIQIIVSMLPNASPWYTLLAVIPVTLGGGFATLLTAVLCHITDVTSEKNRGMRIGIFEVVIALGMVLGTSSSSYLYEATGYTGIYGTSTACCSLACLYFIYLTPETITERDNTTNGEIFSFTNITEMFKTTFRKRENYQRSILLITIFIAILYIVASNADSSVLFLYLREQFNWDLNKYTIYRAARELCWIGGTFIGVYLLHKLCKIPETFMMLIGFLAYFASMMVQGLATKDWHLYMAGGMRCIGGVISPMCRSLTTKLISPDETGKVFSLTVSLECLAVVVGAPIYTLIYNSTISTAPGVFNFVTAGMFGLEIILILVVVAIRRIYRCSYVLLDENVINT